MCLFVLEKNMLSERPDDSVIIHNKLSKRLHCLETLRFVGVIDFVTEHFGISRFILADNLLVSRQKSLWR
jgi:hypothetical protein